MGGNGFPILNQKNRIETNLSSVYVHPANSNLIYLGTGGSAKHRTIPPGKYFEIGWKSTDGGQSWQALGKAGDAPNLSLPLGVSKIAFSAKDQNVVYFATNQGLYKSDDGGETWLKLLNIGVVRSVDVVKNNPNKVFCAIDAHIKDNPNNGIWYSNDGGQTWHHPISIENVPYEKSYLGPKRCEWMQILDDNGKYVYAAIYGRLLQSTDGGMHWEFYNRRNQKPKSANSAFDQGGVGLKQFYIYKANRSIAYADAVGLTFKTTNHGSNWNQTYGVKFKDGSWMNNGFVNTVAADLIIDSKNILVIDPDIGLNLSTDRGKSWRIIQTKKYIYGGSSIMMDSRYYYVLIWK